MQFRALALCLIFALPVVGVLAQEMKVPSATTQAPDPANLVNDWWSWLGDAPPEERASRVSAFEQRLDALSNSLAGVSEPETKARDLLGEIKTLLKAFVDNTTAQRSETQSAVIPQADAEPQSIESLLALSTTRLELELELERTTREVNEQEAAVNAAKQRVSDALAAYIAQRSEAPQRLLSGLGVIRLRLLWALGVAELDRLQGAKKRLELQHQAAITAIERGSANLTASQAELERWAAQLADEQTAGSQADASAAESHLRTTAYADNTLGRIQRRQLQQQLLALEAQRALTTLRRAEAELAIDLATAANGTLPNLQTLRAHENTLDEAVSKITKQLSVWRKATEQERTSANETLNVDVDIEVQQVEQVNRARIQQVDATAKTLISISRQIVRAELLLKLARTQIVAQGGQVGQLTAQAGEGLRDLWTQIQDFSTRSLFTINDTPVTTLGLLRFTVIVLLAWFASGLARKGFAHLSTRRQNMNQASIYTLSRLFHYIILTIGFFVAFSSIGIDFTKFALIASAFGVGLGFGLQAIFSNFVAGLIILFERSLKVGDFVELESGVTGEVQSVNIRSTMITTNDNIDILVPNSEFVNGRVTNWTLREAYRRVRIPFGVAYGTNKDLVKKAALEASDEVAHTLQTSGREPQVWLVNFGDSSLDFELVVWLKPESVKRPGAVNAAYTWAIESALSRYGIEIPFPQRDLHVRSAFGHKDEDGPKLLATISDIKSQTHNQTQREKTDD